MGADNTFGETNFKPQKKYFAKCFDNQVKLFLCSRDIQIGDRVQVDVLLNGVYNEFVFEKECVENGIRVQQFTGVGVYVHYPDSDEGNLFKVIGEISPNAKWVKEGDEFDEDDYYWKLFPRHTHDEDGYTIWLDEDDLPDLNRKIPIYNVKGPCGHFH